MNLLRSFFRHLALQVSVVWAIGLLFLVGCGQPVPPGTNYVFVPGPHHTQTMIAVPASRPAPNTAPPAPEPVETCTIDGVTIKTYIPKRPELRTPWLTKVLAFEFPIQPSLSPTEPILLSVDDDQADVRGPELASSLAQSIINAYPRATALGDAKPIPGRLSIHIRIHRLGVYSAGEQFDPDETVENVRDTKWISDDPSKPQDWATAIAVVDKKFPVHSWVGVPCRTGVDQQFAYLHVDIHDLRPGHHSEFVAPIADSEIYYRDRGPPDGADRAWSKAAIRLRALINLAVTKASLESHPSPALDAQLAALVASGGMSAVPQITKIAEAQSAAKSDAQSAAALRGIRTDTPAGPSVVKYNVEKPIALVTGVSGKISPALKPDSEIGDRATIDLSGQATLTVLHYQTCKEVMVTGGTVSFSPTNYEVSGGGTLRDQAMPCPQFVRLPKIRLGVGSCLMCHGMLRPPEVYIHPDLLVLSLRATSIAFQEDKSNEQKALPLEFNLKMGRPDWPPDFHLDYASNYNVTVYAEEKAIIKFPARTQRKDEAAFVAPITIIYPDN